MDNFVDDEGESPDDSDYVNEDVVDDVTTGYEPYIASFGGVETGDVHSPQLIWAHLYLTHNNMS